MHLLYDKHQELNCMSYWNVERMLVKLNGDEHYVP